MNVYIDYINRTNGPSGDLSHKHFDEANGGGNARRDRKRFEIYYCKAVCAKPWG